MSLEEDLKEERRKGYERIERMIEAAKEKEKIVEKYITLKDKYGERKAYSMMAKNYSNEKMIPALKKYYDYKEISKIAKKPAGDVRAILATDTRHTYDQDLRGELTEKENREIVKEIAYRIKKDDVGEIRNGKFVKMSYLIAEKYRVKPDLVIARLAGWTRGHPRRHNQLMRTYRKRETELRAQTGSDDSPDPDCLEMIIRYGKNDYRTKDGRYVVVRDEESLGEYDIKKEISISKEEIKAMEKDARKKLHKEKRLEYILSGNGECIRIFNPEKKIIYKYP